MQLRRAEVRAVGRHPDAQPRFAWDLNPVFPLAHGETLRAAIPGARLLVLDGVGHDLPGRRGMCSCRR
jgi:hypothetical protein